MPTKPIAKNHTHNFKDTYIMKPKNKFNSRKFIAWLKESAKTNCIDGDLYRDIKADRTFPTKASTTRLNIVCHLSSLGACDGAINGIKSALRRYKLTQPTQF
jgi:hypothetical protein